MFRSEDMTLARVMFVQESWWQTLNAIASIETCMIIPRKVDLHSSIVDYASKYEKRSDELQNVLRQIEQTLKDFEEVIPTPREKAGTYVKSLDDILNLEKNEGRKLLDELDGLIREKYASLTERVQRYNQIVETKMKIKNNIDSHDIIKKQNPSLYEDLSTQYLPGERRLKVLIGYLPAQYVLKVQKLLFRLSRENTIVNSYPLPPPSTDPVLFSRNYVSKVIVSVVVPSSEDNFLFQRISKVIQNYDFVPINNLTEMDELLEAEKENDVLLNQTFSSLKKAFAEFTEGKSLMSLPYFYELKIMLEREAQFASAMKNFQVSEDLYWIDLWVPTRVKSSLNDVLNCSFSSGSRFAQPKVIELYGPNQLSKNTSAPSLFSDHPILAPFQLMVETYGIPRYKELNPSIFTIVSFPFMFALMFGDIGHGAILFGLGLFYTFLCEDEYSVVRPYRYMILLMGFFSLYTGFIYNDFLAVPLIISPSCYDINTFTRTSEDCVYHFGIDWVWFQSSNATLFLNSFKMKFSIIIGVIQMVFGIVLKVANAFYFRNYVDVFFEAIPQLIFMLVIFGFMTLCIIVKWLTAWNPSEAPSIISVFINFTTVSTPIITDAATETTIHRVFIGIAVACVFLMLVPKPIILWRASKNAKKDHKHLNEKDLDSDHKEEEDVPLGEFFIHQMIETIEFVLGSLSNTASYLRLWALSLAHQQLSEVFLSMIMLNSLKDNEGYIGPILVTVLGYFFFALVTGGIILGMDLMECSLHALRLHWVEFQNKFFKGDGIKFEPFNYSPIIGL